MYVGECLQRVVNGGGGERVGCIHGMSFVDEIYSGDQRFLVGKKDAFKDVEKREGNSCIKNICYSDESSSSIGKNSDLCEEELDKSAGDEEVQSSYKGPLDAMQVLEEVLPIRRGISRFYNGKSKSFASLAETASCSSSIKDIAKPDNAYTRKRRNILGCSLARDKIARTSPLGNNVGGISKRVTNPSRATLALTVAMRNPRSIDECNFVGPLPLASSRKDFSSWRSFSLADLQHCVSVNTCTKSNQAATKQS